MKVFEEIEIVECNSLKNTTIYYYLKSHGFSESFISKLRNTENSMFLNGEKTNTRAKIKAGDILKVLNNPSKKSNIQPCKDFPEVLYEDDDFLIVNKPHNLACIPTRRHISENLGGQICNYMQSKAPDFILRISNRLDKETAGIVLIAKNLVAYNNIKNVHKEYFALCYGNLDKSKFTINKPIHTQNSNGINIMKRVISEEGKPSTTHATLIENFSDYCLVNFVLETGRTHQIRVHMLSIGHELVGDTIYFSGNRNKNENLALYNTNHTMLILKKLSFLHFRTNQKISIEIDFPEEWKPFIQS